MVSLPPEDDSRAHVAQTVTRLEREALDQLREAAFGAEPGSIPSPEFLGNVDPRVLAQLLLAALGRSDHPGGDVNPIYALYEVALEHRCDAEAFRSLSEMQAEPKQSGE